MVPADITAELSTTVYVWGTRLLVPIIMVLLGITLYTVLSRAMSRAVHNGWVAPLMELRVRSVLRWSITVVVILAALQTSGVFEHAWAVLSAVLATLAVAFVAIWSVLTNALCAIILIIFKPFQLGQRITLIDFGSTHLIRGDVADINLMFTTLKSDTCEFRIPNTLFFQRIIVTGDWEPQASKPAA